MGKTKKRRRRCGRLVAKAAKGDLIQKILLRLPVKSLLRFKSVCKSWCSLIESSSFIDLHTTTTFNNSSSNKFGSFILVSSVDKRCSPERLSISIPQPKRSPIWPEPYKVSTEYSLIMVSPESKYYDDDDDQHLVLKFDSLGVPQCYQVSYFKTIVGSCNGLICLYDKAVHRFSLWNPATKQHRILPKPIQFGVYLPYYIVAFGFDLETKDYKVVLLSGFKSEFYRPVSPIECVCRIQVYSLSTDSWRVVEGITCLPGDPFQFPMEEVQYVNGSCFFLAGFLRTKHYQPCIRENDRFIIKFDLTKEIITPIQLPDHHRDQDLFLSCSDDKIALFIINHQPGSHSYPPRDDYYIWTYENGSSSVSKDSWTELPSFQMEAKPHERNIPRGISNDGKFAFLELNDSSGSKRMKLHQFASKEVKMTFPSCGSMMGKADAYKPSLVSIIGGNGAASY